MNKLYLIAAVLLLLIPAGFLLWGKTIGRQEVRQQQLTAVIKSEKKHERKTQEVIPLSDADLRKRYCKWVRDSQDLCLQADIPIGARQDD